MFLNFAWHVLLTDSETWNLRRLLDVDASGVSMVVNIVLCVNFECQNWSIIEKIVYYHIILTCDQAYIATTT